MKIELEISDIESLSKALNNSLIAYSDICWAINLGLSILKFEHPNLKNWNMFLKVN